jgi:serine/threonine protein kinase
MCRGMEYLHARGMLHGDLKPENILMSAGGSPKICDFGFSRKSSRSSDLHEVRPGLLYHVLSVDCSRALHFYFRTDNTHTYVRTYLFSYKACGSLAYCSPEMFLHSNGLTTEQCKKSEVYSFALIMWSILTTQRPYYASRPHPPSTSPTFVEAQFVEPFPTFAFVEALSLDESFPKLAPGSEVGKAPSSSKVSFWTSFRRKTDKVARTEHITASLLSSLTHLYDSYFRFDTDEQIDVTFCCLPSSLLKKSHQRSMSGPPAPPPQSIG